MRQPRNSLLLRTGRTLQRVGRLLKSPINYASFELRSAKLGRTIKEAHKVSTALGKTRLELGNIEQLIAKAESIKLKAYEAHNERMSKTYSREVERLNGIKDNLTKRISQLELEKQQAAYRLQDNIFKSYGLTPQERLVRRAERLNAIRARKKS